MALGHHVRCRRLYAPLDDNATLREVFENYWYTIDHNPDAPPGSVRHGMVPNFLKEWPPAFRGRSHAAALRACEAARCGEIDLDKARQAFLVFARKVGIEWTGADPVAVLRENRIRRDRTRESRAQQRPAH